MSEHHRNPAAAPPLLALRGVEACYDGVVTALRGVSLEIPAGTMVALLGANGAGKTTTLKAISQLLGAEGGALTGGEIDYDGQPTRRQSAAQLVARGLAQVLEGRRCFAHLSVEENLRVGSFVRQPSRGELSTALEQIYARFPRLKERRHSQAGLCSGGEQQMLAIGRALMSRPRLMLLDEPSMGLAPRTVQEIFAGLARLNREDGMSFLIAEQNVSIALAHAHRAHVLEGGRVVLSGEAQAIAARDDIQHFYLGGNAQDRRPFIDPHRIRNFRSAAPDARAI
ncbi:MAG TPA: ABC transporter ATP-binding protein [Rhodocyclaceae bacterium]|nr:ABC transporter ATP-binding protein [Rhodocyclaceae bacterium]